MLFENWKHFPYHRAKNVPKKAGFSAFLSHGKFKLVMEKSLNFIAQFLCDPCPVFGTFINKHVYKVVSPYNLSIEPLGSITYLLLAECEVCPASYGPSFFFPREARGP